eukprot:1614464-Heterocapsa_arctica.AAC.1
MHIPHSMRGSRAIRDVRSFTLRSQPASQPARGTETATVTASQPDRQTDNQPRVSQTGVQMLSMCAHARHAMLVRHLRQQKARANYLCP